METKEIPEGFVRVQKRMKESTNISLPNGLKERAHNAGINISAVATAAIEQRVKRIEEENH
jgi:post-segregation antitoxin (ccd killing protein)